MGYRRPHRRRAHIRTNADGSKLFVRGSDVSGHSFNSNKHPTSSNSDNGSGFDELLATIAFACFILFVLGALLGWEDTLWFFITFLVSLGWYIIRNK